MKKIQVGDRVVGVGSYGHRDIEGKIGTVKCIRYVGTELEQFGVAFDETISGHSLDGKAIAGHGWWVERANIKPLSEAKKDKKNDVKQITITELPYVKTYQIVEGDTFKLINADLVPERKTRVIVSGNTVVVFAFGEKGIAKCMPEDKFDESKGIAIATLKALIKYKNKQLATLSK